MYFTRIPNESKIHLGYTTDTSRYMYPARFVGVTLDTYQDTSGYVYLGLFITIYQDTPAHDKRADPVGFCGLLRAAEMSLPTLELHVHQAHSRLIPTRVHVGHAIDPKQKEKQQVQHRREDCVVKQEDWHCLAPTIAQLLRQWVAPCWRSFKIALKRSPPS